MTYRVKQRVSYYAADPDGYYKYVARQMERDAASGVYDIIKGGGIWVIGPVTQDNTRVDGTLVTEITIDIPIKMADSATVFIPDPRYYIPVYSFWDRLKFLLTGQLPTGKYSYLKPPDYDERSDA